MPVIWRATWQPKKSPLRQASHWPQGPPCQPTPTHRGHKTVLVSVKFALESDTLPLDDNGQIGSAGASPVFSSPIGWERIPRNFSRFEPLKPSMYYYLPICSRLARIFMPRK